MYVRAEHFSAPLCGSYCPRWFIVRTHWTEEMRAAERISDQGFTVYLPEHVAEPSKGRRAKRDNIVIDDAGRVGKRLPLFPRYVFVNFDVDLDRWRPICSTPGVERLFGATPETPTPVPFGVVEELMGRPEISTVFKPMDLTGKTLEIEGGAWNLFRGVCEWSTDKRVGVLMSVFGRPATVVDVRRDKVRVV